MTPRPFNKVPLFFITLFAALALIATPASGNEPPSDSPAFARLVLLGEHPIYSQKNTNLIIALSWTVMPSLNFHDGFSPTALTGLMIGDEHVQFTPLGGVIFNENHRIATPTVGARVHARTGHLLSGWLEALFLPQDGCMRLHADIAIHVSQQLEIDLQTAIEGNMAEAKSGMNYLVGPGVQLGNFFENRLFGIRLDAAYQVGQCGGVWCHGPWLQLLLKVRSKNGHGH